MELPPSTPPPQCCCHPPSEKQYWLNSLGCFVSTAMRLPNAPYTREYSHTRWHMVRDTKNLTFPRTTTQNFRAYPCGVPRQSAQTIGGFCADNWQILCGQLADFVRTIGGFRARGSINQFRGIRVYRITGLAISAIKTALPTDLFGLMVRYSLV